MESPPSKPFAPGSSPPDRAAAREQADYGLCVLFSPDISAVGRTVRLPRGRVRLGREVDGSSDLVLTDPAVSKLHAEVDWSEVRQGYLVADQRSSNGTRLNGEVVGRAALEPGDILRLGSSVVSFQLFEQDEAGWRAPQDAELSGRSASLRRSFAQLERAAVADADLAIEGESGTGKRLLARWLHRRSGRTGSVCVVRCATVSAHPVSGELAGELTACADGGSVERAELLGSAEGGTLVLHQVDELSLPAQLALVRALGPKAGRSRATARVVATTSLALSLAVAEGRMRPELFAWLTEWGVSLDPLRKRPEDLYPIWQHLVAARAGGVALELSGGAFEALALHPWPGNVHELLRVVRTLALLKPQGGKVGADDLPAEIAQRVRMGLTDSSVSTQPLVPIQRPPDDR